MSASEKQQFVIVDDADTIQAVIMVRGQEFFCFELLDDAPQNFKEAMRHYPECKLVPIKLSAEVNNPQTV